jgi:hypothetical protein
MTQEQEKAIYRLKVHKEYAGVNKDCCIVNVEDIETVLYMLEEKEYKIKQLGKGQQALMQSRKKWKYRYYKMKNKNKDLQKSVEQIYDDYQDIGKMAFDYSDKLEQKDKIIDLMAERVLLTEEEWKEIKEKNIYNVIKKDTHKLIKQYFENKAKELLNK